MLDRYWYGSTHRISPEAPVPVINVKTIEDRPGGAANVALNIAALGAKVSLLGIVGEDETATSLKNTLESAGVKTYFQSSQLHPTIVKLRVMSRHQQLLRMDFEEPFKANAALNFDSLNDLLSGVKVLVLSDYGKGTLQDHQLLIQKAREKNIQILVDPKGSDFSIYRNANLITPNLSEFEAIVGSCQNDADLAHKGHQLIQNLALDALLVTRSEQGVTLLQKNKPALHLPARGREVFDVTGAGDTVISTLAAALAVDESLSSAVALANLAAGIAVGQLGTAVVSEPELRLALQHEQGRGRGVLTLEQLSSAVKNANIRGERVVFTNGCFDILHAGHVSYLEQARKEGDRLIVAINDDASVTKLKGIGRPINSVERRMAVLAGLKSVDWVISFKEDTPVSLIEQLKPDILVKGGDYKRLSEVVGADLVQGYGGDVRILGLIEGSSTTAIVEKIRG
ncbi:UNVERIFIED_CONTAM: hypothetical protein GTU68_000692 [Idotea baltica]|nr:hypothetical protein [Idotea baltica]